MASAPVFRAALGLNNVTEPHRLKFREDGACELAEAVNVIIDDSGSAKRRKGIIKLVDGACHSLWAKGVYCFFVSGGKLYRYMDGSAVLVNGSCGDADMFFAEYAGRIYCNNGTFRAVLKDMTVTSWVASVPQQHASDTRTFGMPVTFGRVCSFAGRMFAVDGQYLWESEPGNPSCFDLGSGFMDFGEQITDVVAVRGGLYVSTTTRVFFLAGSSKADFVKIEVYQQPMIAGTARQIAGDDTGDGGFLQGVCAIWVSQSGVCIGSEDGKVSNVTSRKLVFDKAINGAGVVMPGQYLFSLEVE